MGIYTNINFLNGNDPDFLKAKDGTTEEREEWEEENRSIEEIPGAIMWNSPDISTETEDEYGGWVIALADIPKDATHIYIHRG